MLAGIDTLGPAMKFLGIPLRKPGSTELTGACAMAVGLWTAAVGLLHVVHADLGARDAGALLLVIAWGCISVRLGIRVDQGHRHLLANGLVSGLLLGCYQVALAVAV